MDMHHSVYNSECEPDTQSGRPDACQGCGSDNYRHAPAVGDGEGGTWHAECLRESYGRCKCGETLWSAAEVQAKRCAGCACKALYLRLPEPRRVSLERA